MDPLSVAAMAGSALKGLKVMVEHGQELESVVKKLGQWYSYAADLQESINEAENPGIVKRVTSSQSVEQEALNATIAKQKLREQETMVRELITWAYGSDVYQEMIQMRRQIKAQREASIYRARRRRRKMIEGTALFIATIFSGGVIWFTVSLIRSAGG